MGIILSPVCSVYYKTVFRHSSHKDVPYKLRRDESQHHASINKITRIDEVDKPGNILITKRIFIAFFTDYFMMR